MATETVELTGHIVDSLLLSKVLDVIVDAPVTYELVEVDIGRTRLDASRVRIELRGDADQIGRLIDELRVHGVERV